jgi:hypothetical protein
MSGRRALLVALTWAALYGPVAAQEGEVTWQRAIAVLAGERTRAEGCASVHKNYSVAKTVSADRGRLMYTEAKAEMDAIIAALSVALAQGEAPDSFDALEPQIETAVARRMKFCEFALSLLPETEDGTKGVIDVIGGALDSIVEAVRDIYLNHREAGAIERSTIRTQLEATKWRAYEDIPS